MTIDPNRSIRTNEMPAFPTDATTVVPPEEHRDDKNEKGKGKKIGLWATIGTVATGLVAGGVMTLGHSSDKAPTPEKTPAASAPVTPGVSESPTTTPTVSETKPWTPADLEVKKPANTLSPELQKLWDGSLSEFLAATDTQRLTVAHAMITPEQLQINMKHDEYSTKYVPFLAPPTEKDNGEKILQYDIVKNLQSGDGRVFHKPTGGLD